MDCSDASEPLGTDEGEKPQGESTTTMDNSLPKVTEVENPAGFPSLEELLNACEPDEGEKPQSESSKSTSTMDNSLPKATEVENPAGFQCLVKMLGKTGSEVIIALKNENFNFIKFLKTENLSPNVVAVVLEVLAAVSECQTCPRHRRALLNNTMATKLYTDVIPSTFGRALSGPTEKLQLPKMLVNFSIVCRRLLLFFPRRAAEKLSTAFVICKSIVQRNEEKHLGIDLKTCVSIFDLHCIRDKSKVDKSKTTTGEKTTVRKKTTVSKKTTFRKNTAFMKKNTARKKKPAMAISPQVTFRSKTLAPAFADIHGPLRPIVFPKKIHSVNHYLGLDFRFIWQDYIRPIRQCIYNYHAPKWSTRRAYKIAECDLKIYQRVCITKLECSPFFGLIHEATFTIDKLKKVDWETSRRLHVGALVCLSYNDFQTVQLATVVRRDIRNLKEGIFHLQFLLDEGMEVQESYPVFTMIESPSYFKALGPYLKNLRPINKDTIPFKRYIVFNKKNVAAPKYLLPETQYVIGPLLAPEIRDTRSDVCKVLDDDSWPSAEDMRLDVTQHRALKFALTNELAIIQGMPGTGKTFLGLKIMEVLLSNVEQLNGTGFPILVICYSNQVLDKFLEGILGFAPASVVRVGEESNSEALRPFNLAYLRKVMNATNDEQCHKNQLYQKMNLIQYEVTQLEIDYKNSWCRILLAKELKELASPLHYEQMQKSSGEFPKDSMKSILVVKWLGRQDEVAANEATEQEDSQFSYFPQFSKSQSERFQKEYGNIKKRQKTMASKMRHVVMMSDEEADKIGDIMVLSSEQRWRLYRLWVSRLRAKMETEEKKLHKEYQACFKLLQEVLKNIDTSILQRAKVIGITTAEAVKYSDVLQSIAPKIAIVEEAAEVQEAVIITTLTQGCQHLILFGDHQQPEPEDIRNGHLKNYNLGLTLFERLIKNGLPHESLTVQHRMRPSISALFAPHIYPALENDQSVKEYEEVEGMGTSVFFINHHHNETSKCDSENHVNQHEAKFLIGLCQYLLQQGYESSQITILTTYIEQQYLFEKLTENTIVANVYCTMVENYQGEENDIILLSLVSSNKKRKLASPKDYNRTCLALTRARKGLYCIGNFDFLVNNDEGWKQILKSMRRDQLIGPNLLLRCPKHPDSTSILVSTATDFRLSPVLDCQLPCQYRLSCGHQCPMKCHKSNKEHLNVKCTEICGKTSCSHDVSVQCNETEDTEHVKNPIHED